MENRNSWYRKLPKMDDILQWEAVKNCIRRYGRARTMEAVNECLNRIRIQIPSLEQESALDLILTHFPQDIESWLAEQSEYKFQKVYNATGVILHTNLGRAPLPRQAVMRAAEKMCGYSNLEYDLGEGKRGERYAHFEELICKVTGAEAAMAVNNNASAVLLMMSAVGAGKEIIVSRGEQIEIGGKFRIPDIMDQNGCTPIEGGTTNKTHASDYEEAITEETAALLKVHTSNFRIEGFTESVSREELVAIGKSHGIPVIEDLGSGVLIDLSQYGMEKEPTVGDSLAAGVDLVSFSGDKLLGGPQAGIIVGKREWIAKCKKHPLTRAMRIDKFTAAMLEEIFRMYVSPDTVTREIPVLRMLTESLADVTLRAEKLLDLVRANLTKAGYRVLLWDCESTAGGGSLPGQVIASKGISISRDDLHINRILDELRGLKTPIILRVEDDRMILDARTLMDEELDGVAEGLIKVLAE